MVDETEQTSPMSTAPRSSSCNSSVSSNNSRNDRNSRREAPEDHVVVRSPKNTVRLHYLQQPAASATSPSSSRQEVSQTRQEEQRILSSSLDEGNPQQTPHQQHQLATTHDGRLESTTTTLHDSSSEFSCATAIFQYSLLESVCGGHGQGQEELQEQHQLLNSSRQPQSSRSLRGPQLPDDPTVQDSIECIFASQLEEGLNLWNDDEEDEEGDEEVDDNSDQDPDATRERRDEASSPSSYWKLPHHNSPINAPSGDELPSPAPLMQSRQKSRTPFVTNALIPAKRRSHPSNNHNNNNKDGGHHHNHHHHHNLRFSSDESSSSSSSNNSGNNNGARRITPNRKRKNRNAIAAKMVHVGTFDPRTNRLLEVGVTDHNLMEEDPMVKVTACTFSHPSTPRVGDDHNHKCFCQSHSAPSVPAEYWPQAPLLLRPTPGEGMTILGVRFSGQTEHLWKPSDGGWWLTPLYEVAGKEAPALPPDMPPMCSQCCLLPINNGNEPLGEALVTDFETPLFEGSLLLRLRFVDGGATCTNPALLEYDDEQGYFAGLNRRYQVVIRGKFKQEMPLTGIVSGCVMDRPIGRLPPKWITKGAVKVLSFFAPQLVVETEGSRPKTLAPLGSTPQALIVQDVGPHDVLPLLDDIVEEPTVAKDNLLQTVFHGGTSLQRARGRKKAFDKLYAANAKQPKTKMSCGSHETYYTFEFLQHLVNFQDFSVELGSLLGSLPIAPILTGQPIPIMAMTKQGAEQKVWSFDIWHESLVEGAKEHDAKKATADAATSETQK